MSDFLRVGVGSGRNIHYFHQKHPEWTYIGNDINPNIHDEIKSVYPDLLNWASIEIIDTLSYLRKADFQTDITFTHGHLMHIPMMSLVKCAVRLQKKQEDASCCMRRI